MRISEQSINDARLNSDNRIDDQKTSNRFSQMLKSKDQKQREDEKDTKNKKDSQDSHQNNSSVAAQPVPATPFIAGDSSLSTTSGPSKTSQSVASTPLQIEKLVTEMGHQIDIFKQDGTAGAINITFDSKTLEGLQVQIRQQDGQLAIRFVTQSDNVSNLLSQHTGELRDALANKGVKIRNIAVSNTLTPPTPQRNRDASA
jgi:flagellar hook-length control protein FliK